ncbi:lactococcin 972 family bacteriocin [Amphibacillus sediminis]|uniref:lactococcin 972 family bacteriocin n=1 Tax=Amphibacillus sediminis TaxID=360185 RepID=UPI00082EC4E9|nr:lactococcin 972 family bacteriocin [Amphibacillus sediminis]
MKKFGLVMVIFTAISLISIPVFAQEDITNGGTVVLKGEPSSITPYTIKDVDGGNGRWDYGTRLTVTLKKKVWSNLDHNTKEHRSSSEIDGNYDNSGWVKARTTSKSSAVGPRNSVAYCNWDVK